MEHQLDQSMRFKIGATKEGHTKSKSGKRIQYDIIEYDPLLDSANMETQLWVKIASDIET